jgi:hypothetical protein
MINTTTTVTTIAHTLPDMPHLLRMASPARKVSNERAGRFPVPRAADSCIRC